MSIIGKLLGFQDTSEQEQNEKWLKQQKKLEKQREKEQLEAFKKVAAEHDADLDLCLQNAEWVKASNPEPWICDYVCSICQKGLGGVTCDKKEGTLYWVTGSWRTPLGYRGFNHDTATPEQKERFHKILLEKFPDADEPSQERLDLIHELHGEQERLEEARARVWAAQYAAKPKCPNCQSTNIRPITQGKRFTSTAVWGLASDTIGKSMECLNCKFKW